MAFRASVRDFQLANPLYVGAEVRFFTVDINGDKTSTLATLYANPTGSVQLVNPQTLDGDGKFVAPVYFEQPMVAEVIGATVGSGETGIIQPVGRWRGEWLTGTVYLTNDFVLGPASPLTSDSGDVFVCNQNFMSGASIAADIAAGKLVLVFDSQDFQALVDDAEVAAAEAEAALASLQVQRRRVLNRLTTPPGSPTAGDSYIVLAVATGAWTGQENKIATWNSSAWVFETPGVGWSAYNVANTTSYDFNGTAWVAFSIPAGSVGTPELADGGVSTAKLADGATTTPKLADDAVTNAKLAEMSAATVKGAILAGNPVDLTGTQIRDSIMPSGSWVGRSFGSNNGHSVAFGTPIPIDDTIPQNTEGTEIISVTHTPKATGNRLRITVVLPNVTGSNAATAIAYALFRNGVANALTAMLLTVNGTSYFMPSTFVHEMDAPSAAAITFSVRAGVSSGTMRFNGDAGRFFGGVGALTITVDEFKA